MATASVLDAPGGLVAEARTDSPAGERRVRAADLRLGQVQRDLVYRLPTYSGAAAQAYEGALCILDAGPYVDRPSHLAYAMRDVVDHLARRAQDRYEAGRRMKRSRRKALLMKVFDRITGKGYGHDAHYQLLADAYAELSRVAHGRARASENVPFEMMPRIEEALHVLTAPQTAINEAADRIMSEDPTTDGARRLIGLISTGAAQYYIVDGLAPDWLGSMAEAGFFGDTTRYGAAHLYLCRCAGDDPEEAARIITSYDAAAVRANPAMYGDLLDCASGLPAPYAGRILGSLMDAGLRDLFVRCPEKYLGAASSLCAVGECALAADLVRDGLTLENIHYGLYPGSDWLSGPLGMFAGALIREDPLLLFGLMADLLEMIIMDRAGEDGRISDSVSSMSAKRPEIAESDQNDSDLESSMVGHMRDCLTSMRDPDQLRTALVIAGRKRPLVYRRLEMFVYDVFPGIFEEEMTDYALRYLGHPHLYHEHYVMLSHHYCSMPPAAKRRILEAIMRPSGDEARDEHRQVRYLECIEGCLDGEHEDTYRDLVKKHGRSPHPGYRSVRGSSHTGPISGPGPLEGKDADQVIEIISGYRPGPDTFQDRMLQGFSNIARSSPAEFSRRAAGLAGASPDAQAEFFRSMAGALQDGREIDWGGAAGLARHVIDAFGKDGRGAGREAVMAVCSMLDDAFQHAPPGAGIRGELQSTIMRLVEVSTPGRDDHLGQLEDEIGSGGGSLDALTMAINNPDGRSFLTMMMYAVWCSDRAGEEVLAPEVREVLDGYAGGTHTVSRNAVIGAYLPRLYHLDRKWALGLVKRICRDIPAGIAFWDGFVRWNYLHKEVFADLRPMYEEFLTGRLSKKVKGGEAFKSTFDHFLTAYLYGYEKSGPAFERFLGSVKVDHPVDLINHYIFQVGAVVRNIQDVSAFDTGRLERLWGHDVLSEHDLTDWFVGSKLDKKDSIRLYAGYAAKSKLRYIPHTLLEELGSHADESPGDVAAALCHLANSYVYRDESEAIRGIMGTLEKYPEVRADLERLTELLARNTRDM